MTLIVAIATDEWVALASDRRVTWRHGNKTERFEDDTMKTFVLDGRFLLGFTGVARIGGVHMEEWLRDVLHGVQTDQMFLAIQTAIQKEFDSQPHAIRSIPHTFAAVGFAKRGKDGIESPGGIYLSNCMSEAGVPNSRRVNGKFLGRQMLLGNQKHHVFTVGWDVPSGERKALDEAVRIALRADPHDPLLLIGPVVEMMRRVAARSRGGVGESILFSSIPRSAVPVNSWALSSGLATVSGANEAVAVYLPANSLSRIDQQVERNGGAVIYPPATYSPDSAMTGMSMIFEGDSVYLPMPDSKTPKFSLQLGDAFMTYDPASINDDPHASA